MSIGSTFTTRLHAFNTIDPRSGPQIIEEAVERAQEEADRRVLECRRALREAAGSLAIVGLLAIHRGYEIVVTCENPTSWLAAFEPFDEDDHPMGFGKTPGAAMDACVAAVEDLLCG